MTMSGPILRLALPTPLPKTFDYLPPQDIDIKELIPGVRVRVPFQSRTLIGVLLSIEKNSTIPYEKLKPALEIIDKTALIPEDLFALCDFASRYYHHALGEVLMHCLPTFLRKGKELPCKFKPFKLTPTGIQKNNLSACHPREGGDPFIIDSRLRGNDTSLYNTELPHQLNEAQHAAVNEILASKASFHVFLLNGVTGSGKTEVYLQVIAELLKDDKQILILVPEISLTPQMIDRFQSRFNVAVVTLHSNLSEKKRAEIWVQTKRGDIKIVIGTRSALFTPFESLGLIIVDEEHDLSFKQQDHFRYHARDLSIVRARLNHVPIVLGSATPSLESQYNVLSGRYTELVLPNRAGGAQLPDYQLIDLRACRVEEGLSKPLLEKIDETLKQNKQALLFLNRRGYAPVMYCTSCAHIIHCNRCATRMVYHQKLNRLQCHQCDAKMMTPRACPSCRLETLCAVGVGTERLEQVLTRHFPDIPIIRIDSDNTKRKDALEKLLLQIQEENKAILIGTQILAKGHHFKNVHLVAMIDIDGGLFSADFRASEYMGQLLMQVAGRAGRVTTKGTVFIQTRNPHHAGLQLLLQQGYHAYSQVLLAEREIVELPPFSHIAVFHAESRDVSIANNFLHEIKIMFNTQLEINICGPIAASLSKRKGYYRQQLIIKTNNRKCLQASLSDCLQKIEKIKSRHKVRWAVDVDPVS